MSDAAVRAIEGGAVDEFAWPYAAAPYRSSKEQKVLEAIARKLSGIVAETVRLDRGSNLWGAFVGRCVELGY